MFVERFPAVAVETYFAKLDGEHAVFETGGLKSCVARVRAVAGRSVCRAVQPSGPSQA